MGDRPAVVDYGQVLDLTSCGVLDGGKVICGKMVADGVDMCR